MTSDWQFWGLENPCQWCHNEEAKPEHQGAFCSGFCLDKFYYQEYYGFTEPQPTNKESE